MNMRSCNKILQCILPAFSRSLELGLLKQGVLWCWVGCGPSLSLMWHLSVHMLWREFLLLNHAFLGFNAYTKKSLFFKRFLGMSSYSMCWLFLSGCFCLEFWWAKRVEGKSSLVPPTPSIPLLSLHPHPHSCNQGLTFLSEPTSSILVGLLEGSTMSSFQGTRLCC